MISTRRPTVRAREAGISLIEVLISMLLLTVIAIGLLPLMTRSVQQNTQAGAYTTSTNWTRTTLEEFSQLPFTSARLTIPGAATDLTTTEFWHPTTHSWETTPPTPVDPTNPTDLEDDPWQRVVVVEQFGITDLEDNGLLDSPLDGDTLDIFVQLKRVRVTISRSGERMLDATPPITIEYIKTV